MACGSNSQKDFRVICEILDHQDQTQKGQPFWDFLSKVFGEQKVTHIIV